MTELGATSGRRSAATSESPSREDRKQAQRQAMLDAALDLARRGGYDAVQMRDIADAVGMSPGSVYNYFQSKDHLLSTLMIDWTTAFADRIEHRRPEGDNTADRIVDIFERASRTLTGDRDATEAMLVAVRHHARASRDAAAKEAVNDLLARALQHAFAADFPRQDRDEIVRILSHVWYALLIGWAAGWTSPDQIRADIAVSARRLTEPVEQRR